MASKTAHDAAKKKAAKEKKMLVVLIVLLVLALGYAYKTFTKIHSSQAPAPVSSTSTTSASSASTSTTPAATTPSSTPVDVPTGTTAAPPVSSSTGGNGADALVSAVTPSLDQGQLKSFTLFDTKDPFNSQGPTTTTGTGTGTGTGSSSGSSGSSQPPAQQKGSSTQTSKPAVAAPTSAVISVNGVSALVSLDATFPVTTDSASNGIFQLVGLTQTTAKIAVVGGSYATGAPTLTLRVGQSVTLANTADGKRYTLELFPQGTAAPATSTATSGATTPTQTTSTTSTTPTS